MTDYFCDVEVAASFFECGFLSNDVSQDVIVTEEDCGDTVGMVVTKAEAEKTGDDFFTVSMTSSKAV